MLQKIKPTPLDTAQRAAAWLRDHELDGKGHQVTQHMNNRVRTWVFRPLSVEGTSALSCSDAELIEYCLSRGFESEPVSASKK
jgi:hypothetical protein